MRGVLEGRPQFAMVSDWMENGDIRSFVRAHGEVNRFKLVRLRPQQALPTTQNDLVLVVGRRR